MNELKMNVKTVWVFRILSLLFLAYFTYDVVIDFERGYIERRGHIYTLEQNTVTFVVNVAKRLGMPLVAIFVTFFILKQKK